MRKDVLVFLIPVIFCAFVFRSSFINFFAQDDFILIDQFSQGKLYEDIGKSFGPPEVTHWRPIHSLYFLIAGNLFGKNYIFYHFLTFLVHVSCGFLVFKISQTIFKQRLLSLFTSFIYLVTPLHFVSLFWISGGATSIGFLLFAASFYLYLHKKNFVAICFFILSLLASEGMISGLALFFAWETLFKKNKMSLKFLARISIVSFVFLAIRYLFFTPKITFDVYKLEFSKKTLEAFKYYSTRVLGFGEGSGDIFSTIVLLIFLIMVSFLIIKKTGNEKNLRLLLVFLITIIAGFFPFILIPNHLSAHYMNISAFGFSMIATLALVKQRSSVIFIFASLFFISSFLSVNLLMDKSWVLERSNFAKHYILEIERISPPEKSLLLFKENGFSTSKEAYISLGTGEALRFWFKDKNYTSCFEFFQRCKLDKNSILIN